VLFEEGFDSEALLSIADKEHVRAVGRDVGGAGLAFFHSERLELAVNAMDAARRLSGSRSFAAVMIGLPPLPVITGHKPGPCTLFATVRVERGRQLAYGRYLQQQQPSVDGFNQAAALVVGCRDVHAVVEVVGEDSLGVIERLDVLTGHDDVADVRTFLVASEHAKGFGSQLAWGP
jgi:hypothetical protein